MDVVPSTYVTCRDVCASVIVYRKAVLLTQHCDVDLAFSLIDDHVRTG
jgi:hypothetical protein